MKKKLLLYLFIALTLLISFNYLYYSSDLGSLKKLIPENIKHVLKKTILYIPYLKKELNSRDLELGKQKKINGKVFAELIKLQQDKNFVNEKQFPKTQFIELDYDEIKIDGLYSKESYKRDGSVVSPFYIEKYKDNLIIASKDGAIYYLSFLDILKKKKNPKTNSSQYR